MRLVINGRFLSQPVTGVQRYARELLAAMDREMANWPGWTAELLAPHGPEDTPAYANIPVRKVGHLHGHAWEQFELPIYAGDGVLFCPSNTAPVTSLLKQNVVVTVHDLSYIYHPEAYTKGFRMLYHLLMPVIMRRADMITVSSSEFKNIVRYYPHAADRLRVVPNGGVPKSVGHSAEALEKMRPYVLYVGSFSRRKNFEAIFQTATRLLAEWDDLRFVFVGGSPKIFTRANQASPEPHPRMVFAGQIDDYHELAPYYRSAEALLFPSLYESSGLPPVEAMANGCPVVASSIPALVERCGDAAVYCDPYSIDDIHQAVTSLIRHPELRADLVNKGLERSKAFSWEICARKTLECIAASKAVNRSAYNDSSVDKAA